MKKYVKKFIKKGAKPLSFKQVKAVSKIVNKKVAKKIETKLSEYSTTYKAQNGIGPTGYFVNLISSLNNSSGIPQGTSESQRIGDKIQCRGIKLRLCFANHPYDGNQPYQVYSGKYSVRIVIFATKNASPDRSTLLRQDSFPLVQSTDTDENKIIMDRTYDFDTTLNYGTITDIAFWSHKRVELFIPGHKIGYKGNVQFSDNSATTLKGYNYYMAVLPALPHDQGSAICSVIWNGVMYYKDA